MDCKNNEIRAAWAVGDQIGALRIAGRFGAINCAQIDV